MSPVVAAALAGFAVGLVALGLVHGAWPLTVLGLLAAAWVAAAWPADRDLHEAMPAPDEEEQR